MVETDVAPAGPARRRSRWFAVSWIGLAVATIAFLWQISDLTDAWDPFRDDLVQHLWILVVLLAVTIRSRTVPLRDLLVFFFLGFFVLTWLARFVAEPAKGAFPLDESNFVPNFFVPFSEEFVKVLPTVLYLVWAARRRLGQLAATDALLLTFAASSGFDIYENALQGVVWGGGWSERPPWSYFLPVINEHDVSSFTVAGRESLTLMSAGHIPWAGLTGLALGVAFLLRGRSRAVWALPVLAYLVSTGSHVLNNEYTGFGTVPGTFPGWLDPLRTVLWSGLLVVVLLVVGTAAAVIFELGIQRWAATRDRMFPPLGPARLAHALQPPYTRERIASARAAFHYALLLRAAHFAAWRGKRLAVPPHDASEIELALTSSRADTVAA